MRYGEGLLEEVRAADRFGCAGGTARQACSQGSGDVGVLPVPPRKVTQL